jgi:prepilin-type N-terminal cleavage/methylation domain-containing protein
MKRSAFSLIELLIVIAIIGILALITVPTAQRIRDRAKQSSCLNNLKQWCYALTSYLDEHRGLMPAYAPGAEDGWFDVLPPYIGVETMSDLMAKNRSGRNKNLFICPSDPDAPNPGPSYYSSYTLNTWVDDGANQPPFKKRIRHSVLKFPTSFVVFTETCHGETGGANLSTLVDPSGRTAFRHHKSINLGFADGSANNFRMLEIWAPSATREKNLGGLQWNPNSDELQ